MAIVGEEVRGGEGAGVLLGGDKVQKAVAARYAARGWLPLIGAAGGKRPRLAGWQKDTFESWSGRWDEGEALLGWEEPIICIRTGPVSGIWVLDVDAKEGGLERWDELQAEHGLVVTRVVRTGGGGRHVIFRWAGRLAEFGNTTRCILSKAGQPAGIDARTEGGVVVAPPSMHASGRRYAFEEGTEELPLAEVPDWLYDELKRGKAKVRTPGGEEGPAGAGGPKTPPAPEDEATGLPPCLGDEIRIAGKRAQLSLELAGELLRHLPCPVSAAHWGAQMNHTKSLVRDKSVQGKEEALYEIFDAWSKTGGGYDAAENRRRWAASGGRGDFRTVIGMAVAEGYRLKAQLDPRDISSTDFTMYHLLRMRAAPVLQEDIEAAIKKCVKMITASPRNIWLRRERNPETGQIRFNEAPSMADYAHVKFTVEGRRKPVSLPDLIEGIVDDIMCDGVGFIPYSPRAPPPDGEKAYNTFQGYLARESPAPEVIAPILEHIDRVWCRGDPCMTEYVLNWLAFLAQRPGEKVGTMLLLHSKRGAGKTIITDFIGNKVLGPDIHRTVTMAKQLLGKFNAALLHKRLLVLNEANLTGPEWKSLNDALKGIVTDEMVEIERKGLEVTTERDYSSFIMCTNHRVSMRIEPSDRRTVCLDLASDHLKDRAYWARLIAAVRDPRAPGAFLAWQLDRPIDSWRPADFPDTPMRRELMTAHMQGVDRYLEERRDEFEVPGAAWGTAALYADYVEWSTRNGEKITATNMQLGAAIVEQGLLKRVQRGPKTAKTYVYEATAQRK